MSTGSDPLDIGDPGLKEWEEFRSGYAAALLFVWLVEELRHDFAGYVEDLHNRFMSGWDIQEALEIDSDLPKDERGFPLPPIGGVLHEGYESELAWMDDADAHALYDQLFPHQAKGNTVPEIGKRMAVVALHGALEAYARSTQVHHRGSLPRAIEEFLSQRDASHLLDSVTMKCLLDCDATRNVIAHNRGVVDERYLRAVPNPAFQLGEFRVVTPADLRSFARAVWKAASAIRRAQSAQGV